MADLGARDAFRISREFKKVGLLAKPRARRAAKHFASTLQRVVIQNASGRPGPRIVTGEYVGAIYSQVSERATSTVAEVGVGGEPAKRMLRLEFGFHGVDSLGRVFDQPPYPHWRPALKQVEPGLERDLAISVLGTLNL